MSFDPFALKFYVNTYWRERPDDAASVARCYRQYLDQLRDVDEVMSTWELGPNYIPYTSVRDDMTSFVQHNAEIGEDGKCDPKDGFSIYAATCDERQIFAVVGTAGGLYPGSLVNGLYFYTNSNGPADTRIVTYHLMKGVVLATVAAWHPDCCAAYSNALRPERSDGRYRKGWITYVSHEHVGGVDLLGVPFSERTPEGGLLLSATEQTFEAANPTHLAGAQRIYEATRHLNDVFPS